ncbi:hypothetical protein ACXPWS_26970 [Mycobacterium sp. BMJ-28]
MTVSLTPAEAEAKIEQINAARDQAVQKLNQIEDAQQQMLSASWHGDSAGSYGRVSQGQREEFDQIISTLNNIVEKGSEHMRSVANLDQS